MYFIKDHWPLVNILTSTFFWLGGMDVRGMRTATSKMAAERGRSSKKLMKI
jgi:hypothetical protein